MILEHFLERLDKVKRNGPGYMARCPAHEDKAPSLSVKEGEDGRILVNCFGGCASADVVASMGLELKDLFADSGLSISEKVAYQREKRERAYSEILNQEMLIIRIARSQIEQGSTLSETDQNRLDQAIRRVKAIREVRL